jgi:hypothetical protein
LSGKINIVPHAEYSLEICGDFEYDTAGEPFLQGDKAEPVAKDKRGKSSKIAPGLPSDARDKAEKPFQLKGVDLKIPFGKCWVIDCISPHRKELWSVLLAG